MTAGWQPGIGIAPPTGHNILKPMPAYRAASMPPTGLLPGDLLLCCPHNGNLTQRSIQKAQYAAYPAADACFTHVALYNGVNIIDATPKYQVCERDWRRAFDQMHVRVRRYIGITDIERRQLCAFAQSLLPMAYNRRGAVLTGVLLHTMSLSARSPGWQNLLQHLRKDSKPSSADPGAMHAAHCGEFVDALYLRKLGRSVTDGGALLPVPAAFSADTAMFADVHPHW